MCHFSRGHFADIRGCVHLTFTRAAVLTVENTTLAKSTALDGAKERRDEKGERDRVARTSDLNAVEYVRDAVVGGRGCR